MAWQASSARLDDSLPPSTITFETFYVFALGLGANFIHVEAVAFLTLFSRIWRIEPVFSSEEEQLQGEAKKEE